MNNKLCEREGCNEIIKREDCVNDYIYSIKKYCSYECSDISNRTNIKTRNNLLGIRRRLTRLEQKVAKLEVKE